MTPLLGEGHNHCSVFLFFTALSYTYLESVEWCCTNPTGEVLDIKHNTRTARTRLANRPKDDQFSKLSQHFFAAGNSGDKPTSIAIAPVLDELHSKDE